MTSALPEPRCEGAVVVVVNLEALFKEGLCQISRLWQAVNTVVNLKVNPTVGIDEVLQVVFVDKVLGYVGKIDAYIFRAVLGGLEIKVLDVKSNKFCAFAGKDAVEEELEKIQGCRPGANVSRIFNVLACNGDASYVWV